MLFSKRFWAGLADGRITLTFRRWKKPQAKPGSRLRTPAGLLIVEAVDVVAPAAISGREAKRAGFASAAELVAALPAGREPVYRIALRHAGEDPRALLRQKVPGDEDLAAIEKRLARLDAASSRGPWTAAVLALIAERPEVRAGDLAPTLGRDLPSFKLDVRKLKELGLTESLEVGYRLSPRGRAVLRRLRRTR